jgi:anti-anti-sigma regulatory factor
MSTTTATHAHIAYERIVDVDADVVVIEFVSREIVGALHAEELAEQLDSLAYAHLPRNFVIDFGNVSSLGSTAFAAIAGFVRCACRVRFCNLDATLRLGAALMGLEGRVEFFNSRPAAIRAAQRDARRGEEDTVDYPCLAEGS